MQALQYAADLLGVERNTDVDRTHEHRDLHEIDPILSDEAALAEALDKFDSMKRSFVRSTMGTPKVIREIRDPKTHRVQVRVWDYRSFTRPNLGVIKPLVYVEHIPVIHQQAGRVDLDILWRVLVAQGLMVHHGTDGGGNVALFTHDNVGNYHARGINAASVGTEHMHYLTTDPWSRHQMFAAAYLDHLVKYWGPRIPLTRGKLGGGNGIATVRLRGHVTHEEVSNAAGYHDRTDPGAKFVALMPEIRELALYFHQHRHF